jgi:hypothetical protein
MFLLSACGSDLLKPQGEISRSFKALDQDLILVDIGNLDVSSSEISGSGAFVVNDPLSGVASEAHFKIDAALREGSLLEFIVFSSSDLKDGISFLFRRSGNLVSLKISNSYRQASWSDTIRLHDEDRVSFSLDVHNQEQPAHFVLWDGLLAGRRMPDLIDSAEDDLNLGNGRGAFWGMRLESATVFQISREQAVKSHD